MRWPVAARIVPQLQDIGKGLYEGAYYLGAADGFGWGLTLGIVIGVVSTIVCFSVIYWAFFKPVSTPRIVRLR